MKIDLYRLFFPVGWAIGIWGALVWVLYHFNLMDYPKFIHPDIMMGGFILCFVLGFLGTAAPKFTNSFPPTKKDMKILYGLALYIFIAQFMPNEIFSRVGAIAVFVFLALFLRKRYLKRTSNPPAPFLFVGVGVITGLIGALILFFSSLKMTSYEVKVLGKLLFFQGYILSFVLGIGSRLIPSLLGHMPAPDMARKEAVSAKTYGVLAAIFLSSYFVEAFLHEVAGQFIRTLILLLVGFYVWKLHLLPKRKGIQPYGLWISAHLTILGLILAGILADYRIHFLHLFYIGGLSLMTLMIATRVTLSHGGHGVQQEVNSKPLLIIIALFVLSAFARMGGGFTSALMFHLFLASTIFIIAMSIWGGLFLPKIFKIKL